MYHDEISGSSCCPCCEAADALRVSGCTDRQRDGRPKHSKQPAARPPSLNRRPSPHRLITHGLEDRITRPVNPSIFSPFSTSSSPPTPAFDVVPGAPSDPIHLLTYIDHIHNEF